MLITAKVDLGSSFKLERIEECITVNALPMTIDKEIELRFYSGERTPDVKFVINDAVDVVTEDGTARSGAVISLVSLDPEPTYSVEPGTEPWGDIMARQSSMTLIS